MEIQDGCHCRTMWPFFFNLVIEFFANDRYLIQSKEIISKFSSIYVPVVFLNSCFDKIGRLIKFTLASMHTPTHA